MSVAINDILTRRSKTERSSSTPVQEVSKEVSNDSSPVQQTSQPVDQDNVITDKAFNALSGADKARHRAAEASYRKQNNLSQDSSSAQPQSPQLDEEAKQDLSDNDRRTSNWELFNLLNPYKPPTPEEIEQEKKKEKREKLFASISDGISALSNLYFTTKYAPNMYDGRRTQTDEAQKKWDKLRKERDLQMNAYIRNAMAAKRNDDLYDDSQKKLKYLRAIQDYKEKKDAEDRAYKAGRDAEKDEQWKQDHDLAVKTQEGKQKVAEGKLAEEKRNNNAKNGIAAARVSETRRHNAVSEGQSAQRINIAKSKGGAKGGGDKGYNTIRLNDGKVYSYDANKTGAIISLGGAMQKKAQAAADRYRKAGDFKNAKYYMDIVMNIGAAKSNDALSALVSKHIREFPSLDNDVRGIIGAPQKATGKKQKTTGKKQKRTVQKKHSNLNQLMKGW